MQSNIKIIPETLKLIANPDMGLIGNNLMVSEYIGKGALLIEVALETLNEIVNNNADLSVAEEALNRMRIISTP